MHRPRGNGKGVRYSRTDSASGRLEDYILPEMLVDPWIGLYDKSYRVEGSSLLHKSIEEISTDEILSASSPKRQNRNASHQD